MTTPLISVGMATYNSAPFLAETIDSILNQTLGNFQFLIADDMSTDNSREIILDYAKSDSRIVPVFGDQKRYCSGQMNQILREAKGIYFAKMDPDDISHPDRFQIQVDYLEKHSELCAVGSATEWIDDEGDTIGRLAYPYNNDSIRRCLMVGCNSMSHPTGMVRMSAIREINGYTEEYLYGQDFDLWLRLSNIGEIANLDDILLKYRVHISQVTSTKSLQVHGFVQQALAAQFKRHHLGDPDFSKFTAPKPATEDRVQRRVIRRALRSGFWKTAIKHYRQMLLRSPFNAETMKATLCMYELLPCLLPWVGARRRESVRQFREPKILSLPVQKTKAA